MAKPKTVDVTKFPPNSAERRSETRRTGQCQRCGTSVPIKDQFTVTKDEDGNVKKAKNAATKANAEANVSHFCGDCADRRVTQLTPGDGKKKAAKPKGKAKAPAKPKGKTKKPAAKGKAKAGVKKPGLKKPKAGSEEEDPFA